MRFVKGFITYLTLAIVLYPATNCPAIIVCPDGETVPGVDVTQFQGAVDWNQVAASGVAFAYARVSNGLTPDFAFPTNYEEIKAAGMIRGAYQRFRPAEDPLAQASLMITSIGTIGSGDLPPVLDVEVTDGQNAAFIGSAVQQWTSAVELATGRTPIVYTGRFFWNDNVDSPASAANPLWIAHWNVACPNTPNIWNSWVFWQYSGTETVPGISGTVHGSLFNGPLNELRILANMTTGAVPGASETAIRVQPNPFNPMTRIHYDIPANGRATLRVYDTRGAVVRTLVNAELTHGGHQATWDGRDAIGRAVASGSYFARLETGGVVTVARMSLIR